MPARRGGNLCMASSPPAPTPLWNLLRLILRATGPSQQDSAPGGTQLASEPAQVTGFPREQEPRIRLHSSFLPLASPGKTSFPLSQLPSAPTSSLPSGHPPAGLQSSWPGLPQGSTSKACSQEPQVLHPLLPLPTPEAAGPLLPIQMRWGGGSPTWLHRNSFTFQKSSWWSFLRTIWPHRSRSSAFWAFEIFGYVSPSFFTFPGEHNSALGDSARSAATTRGPPRAPGGTSRQLPPPLSGSLTPEAATSRLTLTPISKVWPPPPLHVMTSLLPPNPSHVPTRPAPFPLTPATSHLARTVFPRDALW